MYTERACTCACIHACAHVRTHAFRLRAELKGPRCMARSANAVLYVCVYIYISVYPPCLEARSGVSSGPLNSLSNNMNIIKGAHIPEFRNFLKGSRDFSRHSTNA